METTTKTNVIKREKLSKLTLFAYSCGDFASNLCWTFIGSYLSVFYTDIVGLTPAIASTIMLGAKIWDGINDPMFGAIAERTKTKFGRFRPYIMFGSPILAIFSVLTFTTFGSGTTAVIWATVTYIGCGMLYTVVNLSYGSLSTVMTDDPDELVSLNSWRMVGTNVSSVLLNAVTPPLLMLFSGKADTYTASSYTKVAILFAAIAFPLFIFVGKQCKEVIKPVSEGNKVALKDTLKCVMTNKPLMLIFFVQLFALGSFFGRMGVAIYYFMYNMQRLDLVSLLMALPSLMAVVGIVTTKPFIRKVGQMKMQAIGLGGQALALVAIWFVGKSIGYSSVGLIIALHGVYGYFCYTCAIPMALIPDAINYAEDKTGIRTDGTSYAAVSLSTKFASAFGVSGALLVMGMTGYVANQKQTAEALNGINFSVNLFFAFVVAIGIIPALMYPLTEEKNVAIRERLNQKRLENENRS